MKKVSYKEQLNNIRCWPSSLAPKGQSWKQLQIAKNKKANVLQTETTHCQTSQD
jgi:hypothetical protein